MASGAIVALVGRKATAGPDKPRESLGWDEIRAASLVDVTKAGLVQRAEAFYAIQRKHGGVQTAPYHPDTRGVSIRRIFSLQPPTGSR